MLNPSGLAFLTDPGSTESSNVTMQRLVTWQICALKWLFYILCYLKQGIVSSLILMPWKQPSIFLSSSVCPCQHCPWSQLLADSSDSRLYTVQLTMPLNSLLIISLSTTDYMFNTVLLFAWAHTWTCVFSWFNVEHWSY